jgi:hypothetical protein
VDLAPQGGGLHDPGIAPCRLTTRLAVAAAVEVRSATDSLVEEAVTSEPVSEAKFPVSWENAGNFHRQALPSRKTVENRQAATVAYEEIP